jgi:hypothetical protein
MLVGSKLGKGERMYGNEEVVAVDGAGLGCHVGGEDDFVVDLLDSFEE